jgi:hypothetical protein
MKEIAFVNSEMMNGASHVLIDRATLREILLEDLNDVVRFGKEFIHYELTSDGKVMGWFEDGTTVVRDCSSVRMEPAPSSVGNICPKRRSSIQVLLAPLRGCQSGENFTATCLQTCSRGSQAWSRQKPRT